MNNKHGGARERAGRKPRPEPKSRPIWCGQIPDDDREYIIRQLTPEQRYQALMDKATHEAAPCNCPAKDVVHYKTCPAAREMEGEQG